MGGDLPDEVAPRVGGDGVYGDHTEVVIVHPGVGLVRVRVRVRVGGQWSVGGMRVVLRVR